MEFLGATSKLLWSWRVKMLKIIQLVVCGVGILLQRPQSGYHAVPSADSTVCEIQSIAFSWKIYLNGWIWVICSSLELLWVISTRIVKTGIEGSNSSKVNWGTSIWNGEAILLCPLPLCPLREHVFSDGAQVIHCGLWEKLMWLLRGKCHLRSQCGHLSLKRASPSALLNRLLPCAFIFPPTLTASNLMFGALPVLQFWTKLVLTLTWLSYAVVWVVHCIRDIWLTGWAGIYKVHILSSLFQGQWTQSLSLPLSVTTVQYYFV